MKKFIVLLVGAFVALSASNAMAQTPHKVTEQLLFRTSCATCAAAYVQPDSASFNKYGANVADTTIAYSTSQWVIPNGALGADSIFAFRLNLFDAGSTGSIDTMYVIPQVSADGANWVTAASGSVANLAALSMAIGSGKSFSRTFNQKLAPAPVGVTALDVASWPLIRFIILNDSGAAICNMKGNLVHWGTAP